MEYLIRKANGTTVRVSRDEYERILSRVAEGERADKLAESAREIKEQRLPVAELGERRWGAQ